MKVIVNIQDNHIDTYRAICIGCRSILEYSNNDLFQDVDGPFIICPVCKAYLRHNSERNISVESLDLGSAMG